MAGGMRRRGCDRVLDMDIDVPRAEEMEVAGHRDEHDRDDHDQRADDEIKSAVSA